MTRSELVAEIARLEADLSAETARSAGELAGLEAGLANAEFTMHEASTRQDEAYAAEELALRQATLEVTPESVLRATGVDPEAAACATADARFGNLLNATVRSLKHGVAETDPRYTGAHTASVAASIDHRRAIDAVRLIRQAVARCKAPGEKIAGLLATAKSDLDRRDEVARIRKIVAEAPVNEAVRIAAAKTKTEGMKKVRSLLLAIERGTMALKLVDGKPAFVPAEK